MDVCASVCPCVFECILLHFCEKTEENNGVLERSFARNEKEIISDVLILFKKRLVRGG